MPKDKTSTDKVRSEKLMHPDSCRKKKKQRN
jgi:hypothetical protein